MQQKTSRAQGDHHRDRRDGGQVRTRPADHPRGVPQADAEGRSADPGTAVGHIPQRRGATGAQSDTRRETQGCRRVRSGTYLGDRALGSDCFIWIEFLGNERRGSGQGGPGQDFPRVRAHAARLRELLHASGQRESPAAEPGEGEGAAEDIPEGVADGKHSASTNESQFFPNGNLSIDSYVLCPKLWKIKAGTLF